MEEENAFPLFPTKVEKYRWHDTIVAYTGCAAPLISWNSICEILNFDIGWPDAGTII